MKKWMRQWLGVISLEDYQLDQVAQITSDKNQKEEIMKLLQATADLLQKVATNQKLDRTRFETILQHGCFDCFAVVGETHKTNCKYADHIVVKGGHNV